MSNLHIRTNEIFDLKLQNLSDKTNLDKTKIIKLLVSYATPELIEKIKVEKMI